MTDFLLTQSSYHGCLLVVASGRLDAEAAGGARATLYKALADSPAPVVCDLSRVVSFESGTLTLFSSVLAAAGGWPDAPLALAAAPPALRDALGRLGIDRRVAVFATVAAAVAAAPYSWRPEILARTSGLPFTRASAAEARAEVALFCRLLGCSADHADDARLVASELATNAVRHGRPPISMTLLASPDALTISVRDASPAPARLTAPYDEGGQGLALVAALAVSWTSQPIAGDGKIVSARVRLGRT
jgi:anti-sigma regulatory factor (Ser/Thr protein kinase)/anti-anti-sigma regulatory factor